MRILFICDWDYVLLWHPVAKMLKESGFASECIALVVGRIYYEHLRADNAGVFDRIYLMQDGVEEVPDQIPDLDLRITSIEKRYPEAPLWRFVWADRSWVKCGYDEIRKRLVICFDYFEDLYLREKPDFVLANAYASMPHLISYEVARRQGLPIVRPMSVRLEDRYVISDNAMEHEGWINDYHTGKRVLSAATRAEVIRFLDDFRRNGTKPAYQALRAKEHQVGFGHLYRFLRYIYRYWFTGAFQGDHSKANPFRRLWSEVSWRVRRAYFSAPGRWDPYLSDEKYVYFPLHVQPEMSTMTFAPFYLDQLSILENLSKSLPMDHRLVVKEHPSMLGRRSAQYYERIRALPNVRLVNPLADSFEITRNSAAIFTITGTVGLEGLIMRKPVIVLGSTYYRYCPLTIDASKLAPVQWPALLAETLGSYRHDDEVLITFLGAVFEQSFRGIFVEPLAAPDRVLNQENLQILVSQIQRFVLHRQTSSGAVDETASPSVVG